MRARGVALLGALLIAAAVCATTPLTTSNDGYGFDGAFYAAMAGHPRIKPELAHVGPWAYRVAAPAIVKRLPWDTLTNFRVVAFICSAAGVWLMFLILSQLGFTEPLCWIGLALYAGVFWAVKFACYTPGYIDAETQLALLTIIYLTLRGWWLPLIAAMVIGVLVKESLLALLVFSSIAFNRKHGGRLDARNGPLAAALIVLPLLTLAIVRGLVTTVTEIDTGAEIREQLRVLATPRYWAVLLHATFSGLGLLAILAALRPRGWIIFAREHYEWIAYVALGIVLLFGGRDKGRLFLYLLPAAVIAAVLVIENLRALGRGVPGRLWLGLLLLAHAFIGNLLTPVGPVERFAARLTPEHSDATHLVYLWQNLAIAVAFLVATWMLLRPASDAPAVAALRRE